MDKLKNFVEDNRPEFEAMELPDGHMDRFKAKLDRQRRPLTRHKLFLAVSVAACLGLLFALYTQHDKQQAEEVCELSVEIGEVRMYYNMQMNATITKMEELYKQKQTEGTMELMKQTQNVIAANRDFEDKVLPSLPCSETALFAMSQHYDGSISGMNILLRKMEDVVRNERINE